MSMSLIIIIIAQVFGIISWLLSLDVPKESIKLAKTGNIVYHFFITNNPINK